MIFLLRLLGTLAIVGGALLALTEIPAIREDGVFDIGSMAARGVLTSHLVLFFAGFVFFALAEVLAAPYRIIYRLDRPRLPGGAAREDDGDEDGAA